MEQEKQEKQEDRAYTNEQLAELVALFLEQASFIDENKILGGRFVTFKMEFASWMERRDGK